MSSPSEPYTKSKAALKNQKRKLKGRLKTASLLARNATLELERQNLETANAKLLQKRLSRKKKTSVSVASSHQGSEFLRRKTANAPFFNQLFDPLCLHKINPGELRFVPMDPIGRGSFGNVEAFIYQRSLVAVKTLRVPARNDINAESQVLALAANYGFAPKIFGISDTRIVMEFIGSSNSSKRVQWGGLSFPFPVSETLSSVYKSSVTTAVKILLTFHCFQAMQFLHTNNILYRDLKANNCLVQFNSGGQPQKGMELYICICMYEANLHSST